MVTGLVPHVGGPVAGSGAMSVLIGGIPAAIIGDQCICNGPLDVLVKGSASVLANSKPCVRAFSDTTAHGGMIIVGCPTVLIGDFAAENSGSGVAAASSSQGQLKPAEPTASVVGPLKRAEGEEAEESEPSWIGIKLLDFNNLPIPNEKYILQLEGGQVLSGETDSDGYSKHQPVESGSGDVEFHGIKETKDSA